MAFEVVAYDITEGRKILPGNAQIGDVAFLADAIINTVDPDQWDVLGGPASLRVVHRTAPAVAWFLVIRQTPEHHAEIVAILDALKTG